MLDRKVFSNALKRLKKGQWTYDYITDTYIVNSDMKHVDLILEGLDAKGGYCPCKVGKEPQNICPCDDFINTGKCCCKLWVEK
jgi:ferredoxin-thioredoxin reductase catalytic subunit